MSEIKISGEFSLPSKKSLWLVKVIGVNREKFEGKRGNILQAKEQDYYRVEHALQYRKYLIAAVDDVDIKEANFIFEKIKKLSMSADDISYQFSFGFDNEIYAMTMKDLIKNVKDRLKGCKQHIKKAKKVGNSIQDLLTELSATPTKVKERYAKLIFCGVSEWMIELAKIQKMEDR